MDALNYCKDFLDGHGGHPMAAGFTIKRKNLEEFKKMFESYSESKLQEKDLISINEDTLFMVPTIESIRNANEQLKYKSLYESWKKVALKALHLPKDIKKLTDSDTVKEMCDMTEYIELPEEITERDYQLAGATYNPDDEYIPDEFTEDIDDTNNNKQPINDN